MGYFVCARAGPLQVALDGRSVRSIDAGEADSRMPVLVLDDHLGVGSAGGANADDARRLAIEGGGRAAHVLVRDGVKVRHFSDDAEHPLPAWLAALERMVGVRGVLVEDPELVLVLDPAVLVHAALRAG